MMLEILGTLEVTLLSLSLIVQATQLLFTLSLFSETEEMPPMTDEVKNMYS